jgi:hypothetical protein
MVGVIPYAVTSWLSDGNQAMALRSHFMITLASSVLISFSCWRLLRPFGVRGVPLLASVSIVAVFPCLAISSWGPEADILLTAILCGFFTSVASLSFCTIE